MRPTKDEYFMWLAVVAASRSTCSRTKVGCVIVDQLGHVRSTGYNGSAPGAPHDELLVNGRNVRTIHAEANSIAHAQCNLYGCTMYMTMFPCRDCSKLIGAAGVSRIIYLNEYVSEDDFITRKLLSEAGIAVERYVGDCPWLTPFDPTT